LRAVVTKWVESDRLEPGADALARKSLGLPEKPQG
jgi:hypothetical protein